MIEKEVNQSFSSNENSADDLTQYLTFAVGNEEFGVELTSVMEIKAWISPTRLPNAPEFLLGVVNLRGIILPVFDMKARFGVGLTDISANNKVIVFIKFQQRVVGMVVDAVSDIVSVNFQDVRTAPKMQHDIKDEFISGLVGVKDKMIIVLDISKLFAEIDFNLPKNEA
ncbi:MAG: chemotaxis protein CheW [Alphaproteobacteria bacterium]|jgi:purine-binding chemotaxis protein CheW|nr:chemotaxis protein CheW [Candidatus Jidaibacter sp.]